MHDCGESLDTSICRVVVLRDSVLLINLSVRRGFAALASPVLLKGDDWGRHATRVGTRLAVVALPIQALAFVGQQGTVGRQA